MAVGGVPHRPSEGDLQPEGSAHGLPRVRVGAQVSDAPEAR
jgi:hypothetical protein